jgi:hypothetical protein
VSMSGVSRVGHYPKNNIDTERGGKTGMPRPEICMVYFDCGFHVHERVLASFFRDMKAMGADSVFTQFVEYGDVRWLRFRTRLAHEAGLKVYASPGRVAGLFAAGPIPGSVFALKNPDATMRGERGDILIGTSGYVCCVNNPGFQAWYYPFLQKTMLEAGVDGIAFDEPKAADVACWCPYCRALVESPTTASLRLLRETGMADMMGRVCSMMKQACPGFATIAMLMPSASDRFIDLLAAKPDMDYIGVDGPLSRQGPEQANEMIKEPLWLSAPRFIGKVHAAGKKAFVLTETFDVQSWNCAELAEHLPELPTLGADMYAFNYYAHDCNDPEAVMAQVRAGVTICNRPSKLDCKAASRVA